MDNTSSVIFSDMEKDVIGEVMNISLGSSATSLSTMLNKRVDITIPKVNIVKVPDFDFEALEPALGVEIKYVSGLDGVNLMILKVKDAKSIIEILLGTEIPDEEFQMDEINISAICEVMNQMMGSAATALADFLGKPVNISTPVAYEIYDKTDFKNKYFQDEDYLVTVGFDLKIEDKIDSEFINAIPVRLAKDIVESFLKSMEGGSSDIEESPVVEPDEVKVEEPIIREEPLTAKFEEPEVREEIKPEREERPRRKRPPEPEYEDDYYDEYEDDYYDYEEPAPPPRRRAPRRKKEHQQPVKVSPMVYEDFGEDETELTQEQLNNLELIMSVPLQVSVEIGQTKEKIKNILEFTQGTVVELDKQAGAQADVIVNGKIIARGEVVIVNDNFGVRISEILKKDELMKITM